MSISDLAERPPRAPENALHPGVSDMTIPINSNGKAELDHASKQLISGNSESAMRLRSIISSANRLLSRSERFAASDSRPIGSGRYLSAWLGPSMAEAGHNPEYARWQRGSVDEPGEGH